jgi:hypothetical protein
VDKSKGVKIVQCGSCDDDNVIRKADYLIPARKLPYDMIDGTIDKRLIGVCKDCFEGVLDFKKLGKIKVFNIDYPRLVHKNA